MQVHNLKRDHKNKTQPRVGRGGKRGTYSGKGSKGQKAHAGRKIFSHVRERMLHMPKLRGSGNEHIKKDIVTITLASLNKKFESGTIIDFKLLKKSNLLPRTNNEFKIVGKMAQLNKKFVLKNCKTSAGAKESIEKAGGKVEEIIVKQTEKPKEVKATKTQKETK